MCEDVRVGLSARLDGEDAGRPDGVLQEHLLSCPGCRTWYDGAAGVSRRLRLHSVTPLPDLAPAVLAGVRDADLGVPARQGTRIALVVTALVQLALSLPALLWGSDPHAGLHVARELGATDAALAVGVLCAAWRPWRAAGMLPVVAALAVGLSATTAVDVLGGHVPALHELPHLLALVEVALLWRMRHGSRLRPVPVPPAVLRSAA